MEENKEETSANVPESPINSKQKLNCEMSHKFISLVLPVYKQADHVRQVVKAYEAGLAQINHELILVVNGSGDASLDVCRVLEDEYRAVRTTYSERKGWGRAVKLGLKTARGNTLCYTNAARTSATDLMHVIKAAVFQPHDGRQSMPSSPQAATSKIRFFAL